MAVFLFYGQEDYLINEEIKKLKSELLDASFMSMAYKVLDNPPYGNLIDAVQGSPLMFGNSLSVINMDKYFIGNKLNLSDKEIECIDFALSNLNNSVNIIFVCKIDRDENKKPDSRKKLFKTISKYSQVREFPQYRAYQKELNMQIAKMAKEKDITISSDNIALIIQQIGVNLTLINSELEKIKTAVSPKKIIDSNDIKMYGTTCEDIFVLADLIIEGNKNRILKQYNLLTEKRHPLEILSILQNNFQQFIFIKNYEKKMSAKEMSLKLRLHEYIIMKTQEKLRKTPLDKLIEIRENLVNAEYKIKSGQSSFNDIVTELALLS